ncbi:hypothetical protein MJO28_003541 [Puccinia striiformis f. sp. tritici]|uniref:Beta-xylanase n=3 Tax=Puccinia striiformis TaxID=27350 RepID=A0A0L0V2H9_9BASI|nr:hypothetical protein Pst134EA_007874 [Puccinia striiformis f. sp. tritici]KAI9625054.1 hypothetical protein KEM48_008597 [Puccinia striiformis f. sp. tritici PST-130]KNE93493.1 glycosyl hydrolase family 10 [Puccinia striiformis f. sp. tritici PST-78]POV98349.1 hypothetical protein PSTT_14472 [Puccinia striiformis]KAH9460766.1 hypothetical protein Pst134EB_008925 [Puccinia striiformis f. sp. tritici]KAH9470629.1 hypothetical protein Pst134EA_007874 [Puccinia striiformis f. sp. tritici]
MISFMGRRVIFGILLHSSLIWLAWAAPQPPQPAQPHKILIGTAVGAGDLAKEGPYREIVKKYFNLITAQNEMKWDTLEPAPGQYNFAPGDVINNFAKQFNKSIRIHTLFHQGQYPKWVESTNPEDLKMASVKTIEKVIQHFGEKAVAFDLCNEIFDEGGQLRNTVWVQKMSDKYVEFVYQTAREVVRKSGKSGKLLLFLNDYGIEGPGPKADAILKMATDLKRKGLLDAVGFQGHFTVGQVPQGFKDNMKRFTDAGLKVAVTELDVKIDNVANGVSQATREQQVKDFKTVFDACRQLEGCVSVTTWGIAPMDSWIGKGGFAPGSGDAVLFTDKYELKPTLEALMQT